MGDMPEGMEHPRFVVTVVVRFCNGTTSIVEFERGSFLCVTHGAREHLFVGTAASVEKGSARSCMQFLTVGKCPVEKLIKVFGL